MPDAKEQRKAHAQLACEIRSAVVKLAKSANASPVDVCTALLSVVATIAAAMRAAPDGDAGSRGALDELTRRWEDGFGRMMVMVRKGVVDPDADGQS